MNRFLIGGFVLVLLCGSCTQPPERESSSAGELVETESIEAESIEAESIETQAEDGVTGVTLTSANDSSYRFSVTIASEETGCDRYANWWEVITEDGTLLYRRILAHSHVDEQPFTRSGGPVEIAPDEVVIVRSHVHPTGYQAQSMKGSFTTGFVPVTLPTDFASALAEREPLPTSCAF